MKKLSLNNKNSARLSSKGQITIPLNIRVKLNLQMGDHLMVNLEKDKVALKPLPKKSLEEIYGSLPVKKPIDFKKVREVMKNEVVQKQATK